jgi:AraC-like DNA-binding protein
MEQIANRVGFSSASHLASVFRRQEGVTPTLFRRMHAREWANTCGLKPESRFLERSCRAVMSDVSSPEPSRAERLTPLPENVSSLSVARRS